MAKHYIRGKYIWVKGTIDGTFYRYSTGRLATDEDYIFYIKSAKNAQKVLLDIHCQKTPYLKSDKFADFALAYFRTKQSSITEAAYKDMHSRFRRFLQPSFKTQRLDQIDRQDVRRWLSYMFATTTQDITRRTFVLFKEIMNEAYLSDLIEKNPCEKIRDAKLKRKKPKEREPYTVEEVRKIIEAADGWFKTYMIVSFFTGLRTGDILRLERKQVFLEKGVIRLHISKTGEFHEIPMMDIVQDALSKHLAQTASKWVFPNRYGKPYQSPAPLRKKMLKPLLEKLGIEHKDLYSTRHTFASLLINGGADIPWVSKLMSHSSIKTTLDHYNKFMKTDTNRLEIANNIIRKNLKIDAKEEG